MAKRKIDDFVLILEDGGKEVVVINDGEDDEMESKKRKVSLTIESLPMDILSLVLQKLDVKDAISFAGTSNDLRKNVKHALKESRDNGGYGCLCKAPAIFTKSKERSFSDIFKSEWSKMVSFNVQGRSNDDKKDFLLMLKKFKQIHFSKIDLGEFCTQGQKFSVDLSGVSYHAVENMKLRHLKIDGDLSALKNIHTLDIHSDSLNFRLIGLDNNNIHNIRVENEYFQDVTPLSNVFSCNLRGRQITDVKCLRNLHTLNLEGTGVDVHGHWEDISYLRNINTLSLKNKDLMNSRNLRHLSNVKHLDLSGTTITSRLFSPSDLSFLKGCVSLNLKGCWWLKDVSGLKNANIHTLNLSETYVTDISPLTNVKRLNISKFCPQYRQYGNVDYHTSQSNTEIYDDNNIIGNDYRIVASCPFRGEYKFRVVYNGFDHSGFNMEWSTYNSWNSSDKFQIELDKYVSNHRTRINYDYDDPVGRKRMWQDFRNLTSYINFQRSLISE